MELIITDSNDTFDTWLSKDYITDEIRIPLSKAAILIVPFENLRDTPKPIFPIGTEDILRYFNEKLPQDYLIDICITDEDYQEFAFYSDYRRLGNYVLKQIAVPVFASVLAAYVYDKFIKEDDTKPQIQIIDNSKTNIEQSQNVTIDNHISTLADKKYLEPTHIKFSLTIVDTAGKSKNISYEGPASNIDTVLKSLKEYEK